MMTAVALMAKGCVGRVEGEEGPEDSRVGDGPQGSSGLARPRRQDDGLDPAHLAGESAMQQRGSTP